MYGDIIYAGKSKTVYRCADEGRCIIKFNNTATAFNGEKKEEFSGKGRLNAAISNIIFEYLAKHGVKTHLIRTIDSENILVKKTEIIPLEAIVRNLAAGSFCKRYGVDEGSTLKNTVFEFCCKNDKLGDPLINNCQAAALSFATENEMDFLTETALKVNSLLIPFFEKAGIMLVDFKLEFGRYKGEILLCDEISPDSCRLWDIATNEKLDKDRFRRDLGNVMESYAEVLRRIQNAV